MKDSGDQSQAPTFMNMGSTHSMNSHQTGKYGGLIERSWAKKTKYELAQLLNYVYAVSPSFNMMHKVVGIFRILQFIGPSLFVGNQTKGDHWNKEDYSNGIIGVLSIAWNLLTPDAILSGGWIFLVIYTVIVASILIGIVGAAKYFMKNASLPNLVPPGLVIYMGTFGFLFHPIATNVSFNLLGYVISHDIESSESTKLIVSSLFAIFVTVLWMGVYLTVMSSSMTFRPVSLMTTASQPSDLFFILQTLVIAVMGLGTHLNRLGSIITCAIGVLIYGGSIYIPWLLGGFVSHTISAMFTAAATSGIIYTVIQVVLMIMEKQATLVFLVVFIAVFMIFTLVWNFGFEKIQLTRMTLLDRFVDDEAVIDDIPSVNSFVNLAVAGFRGAHPICVSWQLMKMGVEKWPNESMVWFIYAKFVAVYPEETQSLSWIFRTILANKVKGRATTTIKQQLMNIARQREPNLSPELKSKLNTLTKHVTSAKHKLRRVYDLTLQGNIGDMEVSTKKALESIEQCDAELKHIFRQFPNNRFVTRQYARFCKELNGDQALAQEMEDKSRLLQRGITVNRDQAHEWGLIAFSNLPEKTNVQDPKNMLISESLSTSMNESLDEDGDANCVDADDTMVLIKRIDELTFPATRVSMILQLVLFILLFLVPIVAFLIVIPMLEEEFLIPQQYFRILSLVRTDTFALAGWAQQVIYWKLGKIDHPKPTSATPPASVGGSWNLEDQLVFWTNSLTVHAEQLESFRIFDSGDEKLQAAQNNIFEPVFRYRYYPVVENFPLEHRRVTIGGALSDIILQQNGIIGRTLTPSVIRSPIYLNPSYNIPILNPVLTAAHNALTEYIQTVTDKVSEISNFVMCVVIVCVIVLFIGSMIIEVYWINSNKMQVYRCLTALPKNTVSAMTENLRVLKKDAESDSTTSGNTELNKQEENIMKIFATGNTGSSSRLLDAAVIITAAVFITGFHVTCTYLIGTLIKTQVHTVQVSIPHINYLDGAYCLMVAVLTVVLQMNYMGSDLGTIAADKALLLQYYDFRLKNFKDIYNNAKFGKPDLNIPPFSGYSAGVLRATERMSCPNQYAIPKGFSEAVRCYSPDMVMTLIEGVMGARVERYRQNANMVQLEYEPILNDLWSFLTFPVYDALIKPMTEGIPSVVEGELRENRNDVYPGLIILAVLAAVAQICSICDLVSIEAHMRSVLKLLLHAPSKVVLQTQRIMTILSGDFSQQAGDARNRDTEFFHSVVENIPDSVIVASDNHVIESVNKSLIRIAGEDIIGQTVEAVLEMFKGNTSDLLTVFTDSKAKSQDLTFSKNGEEICLAVTALMINQKFVLIMRDTTQTVRYNTLIKEERMKSDHMLASILPPSLVHRVQAGEKNISFAVQSATIVFMDIVSFTPWCGSLPADKVMSTLNNLFKKFDSRCNSYPTMTKIKCIGDCYMAAGGVFAEINQPSEHAREVVSFGLDAIEQVEILNKELNEHLKIRVGINTGGPIVAGVLGTSGGKPTFEILGPTINMAQQMEHHGLPMQVHVSRSVYELIYGDLFIIKERGSVEVKNGSVVTYLVTGRNGEAQQNP